MKRESFDRCEWCGELILPGEPVSPMLVTKMDGTRITQHHECGFRSIAGGANHILRICTCCGGTEPPDPPEMSVRDAARWALQVYHWVEELQKTMKWHREDARWREHVLRALGMSHKEKGPRDGGPKGDGGR